MSILSDLNILPELETIIRIYTNDRPYLDELKAQFTKCRCKTVVICWKNYAVYVHYSGIPGCGGIRGSMYSMGTYKSTGGVSCCRDCFYRISEYDAVNELNFIL